MIVPLYIHLFACDCACNLHQDFRSKVIGCHGGINTPYACSPVCISGSKDEVMTSCASNIDPCTCVFDSPAASSFSYSGSNGSGGYDNFCKSATIITISLIILIIASVLSLTLNQFKCHCCSPGYVLCDVSFFKLGFMTVTFLSHGDGTAHTRTS